MKTKIILTNINNSILSKIQTVILCIFWILIMKNMSILFTFLLLTGFLVKRVLSFFYHINKKLYIEWIRYRQNRVSKKGFNVKKWLSFVLSLIISIDFSLSIYNTDTSVNVPIFIITYTVFSIFLFIPILMYIFIFLIED
jgi:hypothetical protein